MLPNVGMGELIVILLIILVLFGANRLPEVAKGLGRSVKAFKEGLEEGMSSSTSASNNSPAQIEKKDPNNV